MPNGTTGFPQAPSPPDAFRPFFPFTLLARAHERSGRSAIEPTRDAIPATLLRTEVEGLPAAQQLAGAGRLSVHVARAAEIPHCLQEIGRLRELAFRAAGEGTGLAADLDRFDAHYLHLFVWDAREAAIAGAYRLGLADEIAARHGRRGLYTHSLFRYGGRVLQAMHPAVELGRSFVRGEYQRSYAPLMLLWRGIGEFVVRHPRYATLFGAVSISNDYAPASRRLIVDFLNAHNLEHALARHVRPRRPFRSRAAYDRAQFEALADIEDVSRMVGRIERDARGVPILLRQYLKLGGRLLAFGADESFGNALDGLIMVDLRGSDPRMLARYMGEAGAAAFLAWHAAAGACRPQPAA
ncbi:MAG TPA: GNAT family N-acyltransferase [Burkholderiales bacterium]|nr:GNAT family N-acyltransferase [Burkholderiales bacterium]